jgi:DUF1680 family protein
MKQKRSEDRTPRTDSRPHLARLQASPMVPPALEPVRPGSIRPAGRWKAALQVIADGWLRRMVEVEHPHYYSTFWERNTFTAGMGDVHSEWAGYTADAIVRLSRLLPGSWLAKRHGAWLENVLASQDADGYLGCNRPEVRWKHGFEIWSQDRMFQALIYEYEHSGDRRVLDACVRAARCLARNWRTDWFHNVYSRPKSIPGPYQAGHSLNIVHPLLRLYEHTGDEEIRDTALEIYESFNNSGADISANAFLTHDGIMIHIVTVCEHLSIPAKIYAFTGESRMLDASLRAFELLSRSLQVQGCTSGNEFTYGKGPRKYTEHCGVIEWAISCNRLFQQTGQVRFADAAERAMMNAYFASKSPDGVTLCYNHAPNQVVATNWSGPYEDNWDQGMFRNHYSMVHEPRCCNANTSRGFPNYVGQAVALGGDGSVAFVYYGPMTVALNFPEAGPVAFEQRTDYPFEDEVNITVRLQKAARFPLRFRIPCWCRGAEITINGKPADIEILPGRMATVDRTWKPNDKIRIRFDVPISLDWYLGSWHSVPGAAVVRGPLTFTLPIDNQWVYVGKGKPGPKNLEEEWNVIPKKGAVWNVALDLDLANLEKNFKLVKLDVPKNSLPWQHPPIGLETKARVLPDWHTDTVNDKPQTPALPPPRLKPEKRSRKVTLVPFGFTHIHMTYLPVVGVEDAETALENEGKARV